MNKLIFLDKDIKKKYLSLISRENYIDLIIEQMMDEKHSDTIILDIINNEHGFQVIVKIDGENVTLNSDYIKYETHLTCPNWEHATIYSNVIKKNYVPIGKEYRKNNYTILKYHPSDIYPHRFLYKGCSDKDFCYEININALDKDIDDTFVIKALLNNHKPITRIKDLLELMNNIIDLSKCELKIQDKEDYGSTVIVSFKTLTKYVEYIEKSSMNIKIYLEDGKFYQDITESKEIESDFIPYVKKKGEKHG